MVVALAVVGLDIKRLRNSIQFLPGEKAKKHLVKIFSFFIAFLLITILWFLEAIIHLPAFSYTIIILCILIFILSYIALFNPDFFSLPPLLTRKTSYSDNASESRTEAERIHKLFVEKKLYQQQQLTIEKAASQLNISAQHLLEMISTYHGMDFMNYVNTLRINEVIKKIESGELDNKTLLGIAMDSGFSSKLTFNQAFKDIKGSSPTNYFNPDKSN
nr:helix-turn-helix domain-containing protein [Mangrovivirga halotolerans]